MYNGTEDPFILNFNWLTVPSPLSLPTLSLSLFLGNSKFQFKIHFKHQAFKKYIWIWNDKLKNLAGLVPQKSGLCKTWNIGFEYWNMFARAVERKIEWWLMIWVKQHSFQYCSFCLFCNCQEIPSFFSILLVAGLSENSKILSSFLFFSILWLLLTGNSGTSFLISLRPKEKFKCLGDSGKQKVPGNKQKTTFRQKVVFLRQKQAF